MQQGSIFLAPVSRSTETPTTRGPRRDSPTASGSLRTSSTPRQPPIPGYPRFGSESRHPSEAGTTAVSWSASRPHKAAMIVAWPILRLWSLGTSSTVRPSPGAGSRTGRALCTTSTGTPPPRSRRVVSAPLLCPPACGCGKAKQVTPAAPVANSSSWWSRGSGLEPLSIFWRIEGQSLRSPSLIRCEPIGCGAGLAVAANGPEEVFEPALDIGHHCLIYYLRQQRPT